MSYQEEAVEILSDYEIERNKPMPSKHHAFVQGNLNFEIRLKYPDRFRVLSEISLDLPVRDRIPDIAIYPPMEFGEEEIKMTEIPLCTIEILSPTQNHLDLNDNFQETKIKFVYPLFNSDLRYNRQIQEQLYESKSAQKAAYERELRYQITEAYLQYLQALEAEKVWANAKTVLTELRRFNESLVRNNVATRDVVATADYELSKADNEIYKLRSSQNTARAYFNFLINKDLQGEVVADTTLLRVTASAYQPADLIQKALANRQEFAALRAGLAASETDVKRNEANRKLPDFYLGGEFGFQGFGYNFGNDQTYALAQVGLTYDLYDAGLRKSKTQVARLENEKTRTQLTQVQQQIALQVTQRWNDFEATRNTYATSQTGLRAAEETFRIVNNKYRASQVLLIEFLEAQNRVTTARLQTTLAWTEVLLKEAALRQAAGL